MSALINLTMLQAADFLASYQVNDANNNPINLTSLTIESQMRHQYTSNVAVSFTCAGFSNGYLTIKLPAANTLVINSGTYVYDIYVRDQANSISRIIEGTIRVTPNVTQFV